MVFEWRDKVVIITGASTGIGELVVRLMNEFVKLSQLTLFGFEE